MLRKTALFFSVALSAMFFTRGSQAHAGPRFVTVDIPVEATAGADQALSNVLFLNRCKGGCQIKASSVNDSRSNESTIPPNDSTLAEFNGDDAEWNQIVQCVKEMYSPFNVVVTDVDPGTTMFHSEAVVGGLPGQLALSNDIGGISPISGCTPLNSIMNFTFSNSVAKTPGRANYLCGVIGQESAHAFGLDHEFDCATPMTYKNYCGQTFFRSKNMVCGEFNERACRCGGTQNSHAHLLRVFGPGNSITGAPKVSVAAPAANAAVQGEFAVVSNVSDKRGIGRVELWLNGYNWATQTPKRSADQPYLTNGTLTLVAPKAVPNGVIDIEVRAYNDIDVMTKAEVVTVTKGAPCTDASACAVGQKCEAGKCFWDPAVGELGDKCEYAQYCKSGQCADAGNGKQCTQDCFFGVTDTCPKEFECLQGGKDGLCFPAVDAAGCCSVGGDDTSAALVNGGLGVLLLGATLGRRRRRK